MVSNSSSGIYISSADAACEIYNNISAFNTGYGIRVITMANVAVSYNDAYGIGH